MSSLAAFLDGDRLDDVVLYLSDAFLEDDSRLRRVGTETDDGVRLIVDGETGRAAFEAGTGTDPMAFAQEAMATEGTIARTLDAGECPAVEVDGGGGGTDGTDSDGGGGGTDETDETDEIDDNTDNTDDTDDHIARVVFAFAEGQNESVGGRYAEGDVIHAYAHCDCGTRYADSWLVGDRQ